MDNNGFAMISVVFGILVLFIMVSFTTMAILKNEYDLEKDYVSDVSSILDECYRKGEC